LKNGLDREICEERKQAKAAMSLAVKLAGQRALKALESKRSSKRKSLFEA